MALKAWLYDYKTGAGIREEIVIGKPSASWDYEGENSADIVLKAPSSTSLEDDFEPYRRGLMIFDEVGSTRKVIHAGAISKSLINVEKNTITLGIGSTLDYLKNVFIYPYRAVTDSEEGFTIPKSTTEVNAARSILRFPWVEGKPSSSSLPSAPSNISVSVLSNSSKYQLSEALTFFYSDGISVYDALDELKGLRHGIEIREVYTVSQSGTPNLSVELEVYNRFGENKKHIKTANLSKSKVTAYNISEEPYSISRSIIVSRDSDKEEKILSDLQHMTKNSDPLLFDVYESLSEEATASEMSEILTSRLNTDKYSYSIYEIDYVDDRPHNVVIDEFAGSILTSNLPRLGTKARVIGVTHVVGTRLYSLEITTDWSALAYPQPTRKKKKEDAYKKEKERKYKNQRPRKGNGTDNTYKFPHGGGGFPKPDIPEFTPDPTPPDGGGGGDTSVPNPDGSLPIPDGNDTWGEGMEGLSEAYWKITQKTPENNNLIAYTSIPIPDGYRLSQQGRAIDAPFSDINEKGEFYRLLFRNDARVRQSGEDGPSAYNPFSNNHVDYAPVWAGQTSLRNDFTLAIPTAEVIADDTNRRPFLNDRQIGTFGVFKYDVSDGEIKNPKKITDVTIDQEFIDSMGFLDRPDLQVGGTLRFPTYSVFMVYSPVVVGETVFIPLAWTSGVFISGIHRGSHNIQIRFIKVSASGEVSDHDWGFWQHERNTAQSAPAEFDPPASGKWVNMDYNIQQPPSFKKHRHQQALGGLKFMYMGNPDKAEDYRLPGIAPYFIDMWKGNRSRVPFFPYERYPLAGRLISGFTGESSAEAIYPTSEPVMIASGLGGHKWISMNSISLEGERYPNSTNSNGTLAILSGSTANKKPSFTDWSLERYYTSTIVSPPTSTPHTSGFTTPFKTEAFQIGGNVFLPMTTLNDQNVKRREMYFYDEKNKTLNKLDYSKYTGVGNETADSYSFARGEWLYMITQTSYRAWRIQPFQAGAAFPDKGGTTQTDLFAYYEDKRLNIKTPSELDSNQEIREYILRVSQEGNGEMETNQYEPRESRVFRFEENGFEEEKETLIEWEVWASNSLLNRTEDDQTAPLYKVSVTITPTEGSTIDISDSPVIVDNRR